MSDFIKVEIKIESNEQKDILIAELSELGYEFEEIKNILAAYISAANFNRNDLDKILNNKNLSYSLSDVYNKNWNSEWEAGFQPVVIDGYCCVRASFHDPVPGVLYDLIVTPRMSFGTGHHATTYMMIQGMRRLKVEGSTVFDFGTGTGVLAILAHKMGAGRVVAIDNDDWSIENATANFIENNASAVKLLKADKPDLSEQFDIVLANINRNIILQNISLIKQHLVPNGVVLLSGLLRDDKDRVLEAVEKEGLRMSFTLEREGWICLGVC